MKSILLSNMNNLGDVICSTAAMQLIRDNFPGVRLGLIVKSDAEEVMTGHPLVDDLFVHRYKSGKGLAAVRAMAAEIRPKKYDVFLSLDRKLRSVVIALLAGIKTRIVPNRLHRTTTPKWWMPFLATQVIRIAPNSLNNLADMFEEPVRRAFGVEGHGELSLPPLSPAHLDKAASLLAAAGGRPIVGFSVRANAPVKNWPAERFAELMQRLERDFDAFIYITGAPGDREYIDALLGLLQLANPLNLAGKTGLLDVAALARASDLFITLDTGALHLAGNSGLKRLICLFTCTLPEGVTQSCRNGKTFWTGETCCSTGVECDYPCGAAPCHLGISVDEVYAAAAQFLRECGEPVRTETS